MVQYINQRDMHQIQNMGRFKKIFPFDDQKNVDTGP